MLLVVLFWGTPALALLVRPVWDLAALFLFLFWLVLFFITLPRAILRRMSPLVDATALEDPLALLDQKDVPDDHKTLILRLSARVESIGFLPICWLRQWMSRGDQLYMRTFVSPDKRTLATVVAARYAAQLPNTPLSEEISLNSRPDDDHLCMTTNFPRSLRTNPNWSVLHVPGVEVAGLLKIHNARLADATWEPVEQPSTPDEVLETTRRCAIESIKASGMVLIRDGKLVRTKRSTILRLYYREVTGVGAIQQALDRRRTRAELRRLGVHHLV